MALASSLEQRKCSRRSVSSQHPQQGSRLGLWGGPRGAPGPAQGGVSPFPSPQPPQMGFHSRFPFRSTAFGHLSPANPFLWGAVPRRAFSPPGGQRARRWLSPCPAQAQISLSSTLQTAAITTKQQQDMPIGPKERNTSCKPERRERRLALQEERKAGKIGKLGNFSPGKFQDRGLMMDWVCKYHSHVLPQIRAWLGDKVRAAMPSCRQEGKHQAWIPGTVCSQPRRPASNSAKHTRAAWKEVLRLLAKQAGRSALLGNVFCPGWGQGK